MYFISQSFVNIQMDKLLKHILKMINKVSWSKFFNDPPWSTSKGVFQRILFLLSIKYFLMKTSKILKQCIKIYIIRVDKNLLYEFCRDMRSSFWSIYAVDTWFDLITRLHSGWCHLNHVFLSKTRQKYIIYKFICKVAR